MKLDCTDSISISLKSNMAPNYASSPPTTIKTVGTANMGCSTQYIETLGNLFSTFLQSALYTEVSILGGDKQLAL